MISVRDIDRGTLPRDGDEAATIFAMLPPGGSFVYHVGVLARDRQRLLGVGRIARVMRGLAEQGKAQLTQERTTSDGVFVYRCRKALPADRNLALVVMAAGRRAAGGGVAKGAGSAR